MKYLVRLSFFIFYSLLLGSCGNFNDITIGKPQEIQVLGFEANYLKIFASIPVNNPTMHRITIEEIDVKVFLNGQYIGKLLVDEQITIKPKSERLYRLPVKIRLANILNTAFIVMSLKKGKVANFRFEGEAKARTLVVKKSFTIKQSQTVVL